MRIIKISTSLSLVCLCLLNSVILADELQDAKITEQIISLIQKEKDLPLKSLEISTRDGVVKLSGNLETMLQANRTIELAYSVGDVVDVDNNISVQNSSQFIKDAILTTKAKSKLLQLAKTGKISRYYDLHVETTDGELHILGTVNNKNDIAILEKTLLGLHGVEHVKMNVKVKKK